MELTTNERNKRTSREEVMAFERDCPARYFAYLPGEVRIGAHITTWMGDKLATVIDRGGVWTSNMGDRRQSFRAKGINGATYSGTAYLSSGDYVRMRKVKS